MDHKINLSITTINNFFNLEIYKMDQVIRKIQLVAVAFILVATALAFLMEINKMYENGSVDLADLLLLFIYIEVIGMIRLFWESKSIRITYPLLIAITALSRFIILQGKGMDPINLIYEASAILLISLAIVLLRMRKSKLLGLDKIKEGEDS
tara:strand:+ start:91 stop:546 length:456 start_codon:yes stop_codon:yes gene_type:complete